MSSQISVTGQTAVQIDVTRSSRAPCRCTWRSWSGWRWSCCCWCSDRCWCRSVAALGFLLTIGVSLGATTAVFQWGWLSGVFGVAQPAPLISLAPVIVVGILFGWRWTTRCSWSPGSGRRTCTASTPGEAVRRGYASAGIVVAAAATIMTAVFAGFVTSGDQTLKSIAFALAAGVVADAFVVRMLVVPTVLSLLGEAAWWLPRWLGRVVPHVDVEGDGLAGSPPVAPAGARRPEVSPAAG